MVIVLTRRDRELHEASAPTCRRHVGGQDARLSTSTDTSDSMALLPSLALILIIVRMLHRSVAASPQKTRDRKGSLPASSLKDPLGNSQPRSSILSYLSI